MTEPHQYRKVGGKIKKCSECGGDKDATLHLQWLDRQDILAHQETRRKVEECFDRTADFSMGKALCHSCRKCGALVCDFNLDLHADAHVD